jgi:hypothetical protein
MRFMVSLITDGTEMEALTPEERQEYGAKMGAFMGEIQNAGVLADPGAALGPTSGARTLRRKSGKAVVTDGPFAESKEQLAGYMVLECEDLDEAFGWVEKMPVAGAAVEVRPIREQPSEG